MSDWSGPDGWVTVPELMTAAEIDGVLAEVQELLALDPAERHPRDKPAGGTLHLADLQDRSELVAEIVSRLTPMVVDVLGAGATVEASYRSPQPGFGQQKLHADDLPKLDDGPDRGATAIVALCDFTEQNGSTRVVPGSHRRPDWQRGSGSIDRHPDERRLTGPAVTAFVFSAHTLHSGMGNDSTESRPSLQICWRRA